MARNSRSPRATGAAPRSASTRPNDLSLETSSLLAQMTGDAMLPDVLPSLHERAIGATGGICSLLFEQNPRNGILYATSAYGLDIKYAESPYKGRMLKARFLELCQELGSLGAWVRLHYVYPYPHVDEVIALMAESQGGVLPYLDIPFQHASPDVLRRMKRPAAQEKTLDRIRRWREICPELTLRSTFIVGFPGETEADFQILVDWLDKAQLDRVGCFRYEPVRGAAANDLAALVPDDVKEERWNRFMARQQAISIRRLKRKVGTRQQVIIDEVGPTVAKGRSKGDAPEIDGAVYVASRRPLRVGEIATVKIERAEEYDLHGTVVGF